MDPSEWKAALACIVRDCIELRRDIHHHPELSGKEERTQKLLEVEMRKLGAEIVRFENCYGLMATLRNGEGPCVAIRADMDALPVHEQTGLSFASETPGVMHACGHDMHMGMAVGSARWFSANRDKWHGSIRYLFEPQEETTGGGKMMTAQGCMRGVDVIIGQHVNPSYPVGTFYSRSGFVSGASDEVEMLIRGNGCHGAYPHRGIDAIVICAQAICALQTLVSRNLSPFDSAVLTLGMIEGGKANNIVSDEVKVRGTLRTLNNDVRTMMQERARSLVSNLCKGMGGEGEIRFLESYGAVYNEPEYYVDVEKTAIQLLGRQGLVVQQAPSLGVESFCFFLKETPGVYYDLGSGVSSALHAPTFVADEGVLEIGIMMQCASVLELMRHINERKGV